MADTRVQFSVEFSNRQPAAISAKRQLLHFNWGTTQAEYVPTSECQVNGRWQYCFMVQSADLPADVELSQVTSENMVSPFVTMIAPPLEHCFEFLEEAEDGAFDFWIVGVVHCGKICLRKAYPLEDGSPPLGEGSDGGYGCYSDAYGTDPLTE